MRSTRTPSRTSANRPLTEAELLQHVRDAARWLGLLEYHTRDSRGSTPGFPDLVLAGPGGLIFRELKSETGRPTWEQREWLDQLRRAGADAGYWYPHQWPEPIMTDLRILAGQKPEPKGSDHV